MKRTLLAVGFALLISMLLAPHKEPWRWLGKTFYVRLDLSDEQRCTQGFDVRWNEYGGYWQRVCRGGYRNDYVPDWCNAVRWFPAFWLEDRNPVLWSNFVGQTVFVIVLAAVLVNLRKSSRSSAELPAKDR
jgi:mannose/fructose/N-acetylgalactosamine-specific phosphotransferase system component IIC